MVSYGYPHYILRAGEGIPYVCGVGREGLLQAVSFVMDPTNRIDTAIIERGSLPINVGELHNAEVIAVVDVNGLLGLGPVGQFWTTRALTHEERRTMQHIGPVILSVDIAQAEVAYAYRNAALETGQWGARSRGLEDAVRAAICAGYGFVVRRVRGIPGEQVIACYTEAGFFFTMCADDRERHAIIVTRELIENFGDALPVLELNDPTVKARLVAWLRGIVGKTAAEQARLGHHLMGRAQAIAAAAMPLTLLTQIAN